MIRLARAITALNRLFFDCAKWLVYVIALLMIYEVVARYSFHSPTSWAPELATLIFGPFFLLGGPYLLHLGGHVAVDILSVKAGEKTAPALAAIGFLLAILFSAILLRYGLPLALQSLQYGETSYSTWNPVVWPTKTILPLAAGLLVLQALAELIFTFRPSETGE